jgi:hypothetical protein
MLVFMGRLAGSGTRAVALLTIAALAAPSCAILSYRYEAPPPESPARRADLLYFRIEQLQGLSMGGIDELKHSMKTNTVFAQSQLVDTIPGRGVSVNVKAVWVPPSLGAAVYGYISLGLLALLPVYSDSMGYDVEYTVFVDGKRIRYYEYPIRRRVFMWLPVLPFVWINLLTSSEGDAFAAVTRHFFDDARQDGAFDGRNPLPAAAPVASADGPPRY